MTLRSISTASVRRVPAAWLAQVRPGGEIVTPWFANAQGFGLIWLRVRDDGTALGWIHGGEAFMPLRGQRIVRPDVRAVWTATRHGAEQVAAVPDLADLDVHGRFALGVRLPGVVCWEEAEGWFLLTDDGSSWARISGRTSCRYGPRDLLAEVEAAVMWWRENGRPQLFDFGVTVTRDRQEIWLGSPDGVVSDVPPPL